MLTVLLSTVFSFFPFFFDFFLWFGRFFFIFCCEFFMKLLCHFQIYCMYFYWKLDCVVTTTTIEDCLCVCAFLDYCWRNWPLKEKKMRFQNHKLLQIHCQRWIHVYYDGIWLENRIFEDPHVFCLSFCFVSSSISIVFWFEFLNKIGTKTRSYFTKLE